MKRLTLSRLPRILFLPAAYLCLAAWLAVRAWVPLMGLAPAAVIALLALAASAAVLWGFHRLFAAYPHLLDPFRAPSLTPDFALLAVAFLLGGLFDVSYSLRTMDGQPVTHPVVRLLCHGGNAFVFAVIVLVLVSCLRELKGFARVDWREVLLLAAVLNALTLLDLLTSRTVYVWDVAGYWTVARDLAAAPLGYDQLREVLRSTISMDYNYLLAWPISLLMRVFGGSRAVFLFAITDLYVLPGGVAICALGRERRWGGLTLLALFPLLMCTALVGFVDVAAFSLALWAFLVYFSDRPALSRGIVAGALLVGTFLLRRYFFFFAASFGVAALVCKLIFDRKRWTDFLALFGSCAVCALTFTYRFLLEKVAASNYGDLYSAYDLGLRYDAFLIGRYVGMGILLCLLAGAAVALLRGVGQDRPRVAFCLIQIGVCFAAFVLVQSHGQQHLLLYLPALLILAAVSPLFRSPRPWAPVLAALVLLYTLIPKDNYQTLCSKLGVPDVLPTATFYGITRDDTDQLLALDDYLNSLSEGGTKAASVCASSLLFNCETMMNLRPSLNLPDAQAPIRYFYVSSVDKRDSFSWNMLQADYLVVGDPVQVHLGEENQQVVALMNRAVLSGEGIGSAYTRMPPTFTLEDGSTLYVYRRDRPITHAEYQWVSDSLTARYPDYAQLYALPDGF